MKLLNRGLALAVMGAGLAALPTIGVQAAPAAQADPNGVAAMADRASGEVAVTREEATKKVGFIRVKGDGDLLPSVEGNSLDAAKDKADAYLDQYAANFGARPDELVRTGVAESAAGWTATYTQSYKGVAVFGSMLRVHVDHEGDLTAVNGYAAPDLSLSVDPRISADDAGKRAVGLVREDPPAHDGETADLTGIAPKNSELVVYRMGVDPGRGRHEPCSPTRSRSPTTTTSATPSSSTRRPASRSTAGRWSHDALEPRALREEPRHRPTGCGRRATRSRAPSTPTSRTSSTRAGESYWFFENAFGRDSYDGNGAIDAHGQQRPDASAAPTPTGTASRPTTATASPPTTSSRTSGATPTPSTPPA